MKKKNNVLFFTLVIFTIMMAFSCKQNVGLGGTVDIERPEGSITYPDAGETPIRGSFVMRGTAYDDDGIKSITISFKNIETKETVYSQSVGGFTEGDGSVSWSITIDNESKGFEAAPHELVKKYPIPDGEYTAILTVTDKGGKTYETTKNYKIDNTPPVFIVNRPSTKSAHGENPSSGDSYGAIFTVVGQVGEKNTVEKLVVQVPGTDIDIPKWFVGKNINVQVAVETNVPPTAPDDPLYKEQAKDINKAIKAQLFLFDNARLKNDVSSSNEGNKADWYYLSDDIYVDVLSKGYTPEVISDYFAGKKGLGGTEHDNKIKALRDVTVDEYNSAVSNDANATEASRVLKAIKSKMLKMSEKRSTFKLDPSKSPGFKVLNGTNIPKKELTVGKLASASSIIFKNGQETSFIVELLRNKDRAPLVNGTDLNAYKGSDIEIALYKSKETSGSQAEVDSFKNGTNLEKTNTLLKFADLTEGDLNDLIKVEGESIRVKCKLPNPFVEGKYLLKVEGKDSTGADSNAFEAYDDSNSVNNGLYIIHFIATGNGPRIRVTNPPEGFYNKNFEVFINVPGLEYVSGSPEHSGKVYYNVVPDNTTSDSHTFSENASQVFTKVNTDPNDTKYKATIDISGCADDDTKPEKGSYRILLLAKNPSGSSDTDRIYFSVDKKAPIVKITHPLPNDPQGGAITISGTISDLKAGVKASSTKYILGKKSPAPTVDSTGWQSMTTSSKGSWSADVNLSSLTTSDYDEAHGPYKKIPMYILVEDEIGNKIVHTKEILYNPDGTKPIVKILSPQNNSVLGGTIQIFGTTRVIVGTPSDLGEAYIMFSKSGNFSGGDDGKFGGVDWQNGGQGRPIPGTNTAGSSQWSLTINENKEFDPLSGNKWKIYFKVRANNKGQTPNVMGEWSDRIEIEIDKSAPRIGSPELLKIKHLLGDRPYVPNMWIKEHELLTGSLYDESGIKELTISGDLDNGVPCNLSQAIAKGWIEEDTVNTPSGISASGSAKNYKLKLPLNLNNLTDSAKRDNAFSIRIDIKEDTDQGTPTSKEFNFRFDTKKPIGDYGTDLYVSNYNFSTTSVSDSRLAAKVGTEWTNKKIIIDDKILTITGNAGGVVSFNPSISAASYNYILYESKNLIFDERGGNDMFVRGVAFDDGSGVEKVIAWLKVDNTETDKVTITEVDNTNKLQKQLGSLYTWSGKIDLSPLKDGKGKLHYKIIDKSGNEYETDVDVRVKNKSIKVSQVILKTDIGGNPSEFGTGSLSGALNPESRDFEGELISKNFAFKNKANSKIKVSFTGGEGQIKYILKYNNAPLDGHNLKNIATGDEITLSAADLQTIGNSDGTPKELTLELWDKAHDLEQGETTSSAKIKIKTLFEALDNTPPVVVILPLHWNNENDNSLYENNRKNGHVEIAKFTGSTNDYSSVSGRVTIRGFAYDNVQLKELTATLPNASNITITKGDNDNNWTEYKDMTTAGTSKNIKFEVEESKYDYLGYYVKWKLEWDSEKTPVGLAKSISVSANDGTNASSALASNASTESTSVVREDKDSAKHADFANAKPGQFILFTNGEAQYLTRVKSVKADNKIELMNDVDVQFKNATLYKYKTNKPNINVNVVPYVTKIETVLSKLGGADPDLYARTALGRYPVRDDETIKIHGFSLTGASVTVGGKPTNNLAGDSSPWTLNFTDNASTGSVDESKVKSGALELKVGTVSAINNLSNNNKPYNKAKKTASNDKLTDDLYLDVWQFNSQAALPDRGTITEPVMRINPESGMIGFAFANGPDYFSMSDGTEDSYRKWHQNYDDFANVDFIYDSEGNSHAVVVGRDINSQNEEAGKFTYLYSMWGAPKGSWLWPKNNYKGTHAIRLETIGQEKTMDGAGGNILDKDRIQHPSLAAAKRRGNATPLYLAYYDAINDQIRFKYGNNNQNHKLTDGAFGTDKYWKKVFGQFKDQDSDWYIKPYAQNDVTIVAGKYQGGDTGNKAGTYLSLGVVSGTNDADDVAVLIWFDETNQKLKYTYKKDPQNGNHASQVGNGNGNWKKPVDVFGKMNVGEYCKIAVDKAGGIHIAAFDTEAADLKYAYLPTYSATSFKTCTVDAYGITGTHITLDVAYTENGANGKPVPYIGYYSSSVGRSKLAYLANTSGAVGEAAGTDENGYFTGKWEVSVVPTVSRVQQDNINVGVWKTADGVIKNSVTGVSSSDRDAGKVYGNGTSSPVLAYAVRKVMNGYIETAQKK